MDICVRKLIGADSQNVCVIPTSCPPMPDSSRLNKQKKATVHCKVCGVLQFLFLFLFSSFYQIDSHHETCVAFCKSAMKHPQKSDWKSGFLWFSYGYWKCTFVDWIHKFSPSCSLLTHILWSSPCNHTPIIYTCFNIEKKYLNDIHKPYIWFEIQLHIYFWALDGIASCLIQLAIMNHEDCWFKYQKSESRCKSFTRTKWRFFLLCLNDHIDLPHHVDYWAWNGVLTLNP